MHEMRDIPPEVQNILNLLQSTGADVQVVHGPPPEIRREIDEDTDLLRQVLMAIVANSGNNLRVPKSILKVIHPDDKLTFNTDFISGDLLISRNSGKSRNEPYFGEQMPVRFPR